MADEGSIITDLNLGNEANGQDDDPEGFPREDTNNSDKDVQIIDVVATDPNKKTNVIEDEKKENNEEDSKSED